MYQEQHHLQVSGGNARVLRYVRAGQHLLEDKDKDKDEDRDTTSDSELQSSESEKTT